MLEGLVEYLDVPKDRVLALKWFAFMLQQADWWPCGGEEHQQSHWARVLVLALKLAESVGLSDADKEALCAAAAFHDTRRVSSWPDEGHGDRAADFYADYCSARHLDFDPRAYLAIKWHDRDDNDGTAAIAQWDRDHPIGSAGMADSPTDIGKLQNRWSDEGWQAEALLIYRIFKDADGLDRVRLDKSALNVDYLRLTMARSMRPFAEDLLQASALPGSLGPLEGAPQPYLVVVDVQNDFVTGSLGSEDAQRVLPAIEQRVREFEGQVVFTKDTHGARYLDAQEGRLLPRPHCLVCSAGWQLAAGMDDIRRQLRAPVLLKGTFGSPELAAGLRAAAAWGNVASVEFVGLCTDICVASNVVITKAMLPEVPVTVRASCCAGSTPEMHAAALSTMGCCQAVVVE